MQPEDRVAFYWRVCESTGLNPLTRPFEFISLNGKLTLYAKKDATDQLRKLHGVTVARLERERTDDLMIVTAHGTTSDGREDSAIGAVAIKGLAGEALANALMKAETKAKRRLTLSLVGLGFLDESEIDGAERVDVDPATGEIAEAPAKPRRCSTPSTRRPSAWRSPSSRTRPSPSPSGRRRRRGRGGRAHRSRARGPGADGEPGVRRVPRGAPDLDRLREGRGRPAVPGRAVAERRAAGRPRCRAREGGLTCRATSDARRLDVDGSSSGSDADLEARAGVLMGRFNELYPVREAVTQGELTFGFLVNTKPFDVMTERLVCGSIGKSVKASTSSGATHGPRRR
jgi:hypothetical protein